MAQPARRRRLRLVLGLIGTSVFLLSFVALVWGDAILHGLTLRHFSVAPPPAGFPAPADRAEANRQDLDYLGNFVRLDASLTTETGAAFETERQALLARAATLSPAQLAMGVARAVAHAGNPDSNVDLDSADHGQNRLPLRLEWFAEGVYVVSVLPGEEALLGARIETIGGRTPAELAAGFRPFHGGGTTGEEATASLSFMVWPAAQNVVWPDLPLTEVPLRVTLADGAAHDLTLAAGPIPKTGWLPLLSGKLPLSLQEPGRSFFSRIVGDGLYLRLNRATDDAEGPIGRYFAAAVGSFHQGALSFVILDLRHATSGDYSSAVASVQALPSLLTSAGRLFILTGPGTGSAGVAVAAWAKQAAGARAIIEGEAPGETERFWSVEGPALTLPNSGLRVPFATAYHDWNTGCRSLACYWPDIVDGVAAGELTPDVIVKWRFEDYRAGIDTVLRRLGEMTRVKELAAGTAAP